VGDFARATAVEERDGKYPVELAREWEGMPGAPNGGYLAAMALRAASCSAPQLWPASIHCVFLNRAQFGSAHFEIHELRRGRSVCQRVELHQGDKIIMNATAWFTNAASPGYEFQMQDAPRVSPPEDCPDFFATEAAISPCVRQMDIRTCMQPTAEAPEPVTHGWHRFPREDHDADTILSAARLLFLSDIRALGPVMRKAAKSAWELPYLAMTLDLYAQFYHSGGPSDWVLATARANAASRGLVGSQIQIWASDNRPMAAVSLTNLCLPNPLLKAAQ
jgi:acyl-CoA thioesterase